MFSSALGVLEHHIENIDLLSACSNAGLNCPSSKPPGIMKWWKKTVAISVLCRAVWPMAEPVCWQEAVFTKNFCGLWPFS